MSDHNFEKQVQQKLDELKIPPADNVWSSIEVRIRKDKRRRRGLLLLPFLLLLIGGAFYFAAIQTGVPGDKLVQQSAPTKNADHKENSTSQQPTVENGKASTPQVDANSKSKPQPDITGTEPGSNDITSGQAKKSDIPRRKAGSVSSQTKGVEKGFVPNIAVRSVQSTNQQVVVSKKERKSETLVGNNEGDNGRAKTLEKGSNEKAFQDQSADVNKDQVRDATTLIDSAAKGVRNEVDSKVDVDTSTASDPIAQLSKDSTLTADNTNSKKQPTAKTKISSKLKLGANLSIGASNMVEGGIFQGGLLGGFISEEKALVADVGSNATPNSPPNNGPLPVSYKPSSIARGLAFSVGASVQKSISKRFSISTGLQYRFYSTHIRVGNRVDTSLSLQNAFGSSTINRYYMAAPISTTSRYTNRFHFLELPLAAHLQLNKGNKLPILLNAGGSLTYLVATNALHFDSRTGFYYPDNALFNKLQANLSAGLAVSVRSKSSMPLHIGPQFQWSLTNLLKKDVSDKRLFYLGLGARVFFNK